MGATCSRPTPRPLPSLTFRIQVDSRAFKNRQPTAIGARYEFTLTAGKDGPTATLVRERYIRDGAFETKRAVGASGVTTLRPFQLGSRRYWLGRFVLRGETGTEFVRAIAWTFDGDSLIGVMITGHPDVPVGLLVGQRRRPANPRPDWDTTLSRLDRPPLEARCVLEESNLDCALANQLRAVAAGQAR